MWAGHSLFSRPALVDCDAASGEVNHRMRLTMQTHVDGRGSMLRGHAPSGQLGGFASRSLQQAHSDGSA